MSILRNGPVALSNLRTPVVWPGSDDFSLKNLLLLLLILGFLESFHIVFCLCYKLRSIYIYIDSRST